MVEVTVRVCDVCGDRISSGKCPICEKDVCKPCTQTFSLELGMKWKGPTMEVFAEKICKNCAKGLEGRSKEIIENVSRDVRPRIKELLRTYTCE